MESQDVKMMIDNIIKEMENGSKTYYVIKGTFSKRRVMVFKKNRVVKCFFIFKNGASEFQSLILYLEGKKVKLDKYPDLSFKARIG